MGSSTMTRTRSATRQVGLARAAPHRELTGLAMALSLRGARAQPPGRL